MRWIVGSVLVLCAACDGSEVARTTQLEFRIAGIAAGLTPDEDLLIANLAGGAPRLVKLDHEELTFQDVGQGIGDTDTVGGVMVADDGTWWAMPGYSRAPGAPRWEPIALPVNFIIKGFEADGTPWGFDRSTGVEVVFRRAADKQTWTPVFTSTSPSDGVLDLIKGGALMTDLRAGTTTYLSSDGAVAPTALLTCPTDRIEQACQNARVMFSHPRRREFYVGQMGAPGVPGHLYRVPADAAFPVPFDQLEEVTPEGTGRWRHLRMADDGRLYLHIENLDGTNPVLHLEPNDDTFIEDTELVSLQGLFLATPSRAYRTSFQFAGALTVADPVYVFDY